jgi:hypothetical protein
MRRHERAPRRASVNVDEMRRHVEQLLAGLMNPNDEISIYRVKRLHQARVLRDPRNGEPLEIQLPAIRSALSYATALHEIGHVKGRYQAMRNTTTTCERWAWQWAREHALIWTDAMERSAATSLACAHKRHLRDKTSWRA